MALWKRGPACNCAGLGCVVVVVVLSKPACDSVWASNPYSRVRGLSVYRDMIYFLYDLDRLGAAGLVGDSFATNRHKAATDNTEIEMMEVEAMIN